MDIIAVEKHLRERLSELMNRLERIKADVTQPHSSDFAEQAQERENDEVVDQIGNEIRAEINQVNKALERVASGDYGICQVCTEDIDEKRLQVVPHAVRCVNCAE